MKQFSFGLVYYAASRELSIVSDAGAAVYHNVEKARIPVFVREFCSKERGVGAGALWACLNSLYLLWLLCLPSHQRKNEAKSGWYES